jgi:lipid-A-disaccharide synthase
MAKFAAQNGIRVFYYISPQVWAWKRSRVKAIKQYVERMYVILPFEKEFYEKYQYEVDFVGHPLLDAIRDEPGIEQDLKKDLGLGPEPVIAILPGSRKQEIRTMLPVMLQMVKKYPGHQFVVAAAPSQDESLYNNLIGNRKVKVIPSRMHDILRVSTAAMVTSGTATLETALFRVPEVVCYKGGWLSYYIARWLIRDIQYISLVNLIMDREVVTELIQGNFTAKTLHHELARILEDGPVRTKILSDLDELRTRLGGPGASKTAAELMFNRLKEVR